MKIEIAESEWAIASCFPVMVELRPHLTSKTFVARVLAQQAQGYQLAYLTEAEAPVAVAGFRISHNLAWGRFLYVDDLVTLAEQRSHGYGAALLAWLHSYAAKAGCEQLHLDSGMQRKEAHRFYEREGIEIVGYHFSQTI